MNPVVTFLELVKQERPQHCTEESAARAVAVKHPRLVRDVLDQIGLWPSSEIALRVLQS